MHDQRYVEVAELCHFRDFEFHGSSSLPPLRIPLFERTLFDCLRSHDGESIVEEALSAKSLPWKYSSALARTQGASSGSLGFF
jgi:hypothetical protein